MQVAGSVDLGEALVGLAASRPIFHSEADFQLALGWELRQCDPAMRVRLEARPEPGTHLDLSCERPDLHRFTALELKYLTRSWSGELEGERYDLRNQWAQDTRGYDVVKDISRVERFVAGRPGSDGAVVVITNDPYYWGPKLRGHGTTNAEAFRIGEGTVLSGLREWGPKTGAGTNKGRQVAIPLRGTYTLRWQDYSTVVISGTRATRFRLLVVPVRPEGSP
jgi:hypothetical protein